MIFLAKIINGEIVFNNDKASKYLESIKDETIVEIDIKKPLSNITKLQNRALHLWFTQLADEFNRTGYDVRRLIKPGIDIMWSSYAVKEYLFRPVMEAYLGKKSTKDLTTKQINDIFDILNKVIGERTGLYIPFPSIENFRDYK